MTAGPTFDVQTTRDVAQGNRRDRVGFALIFAVVSLFILPWQAALAWIIAIAAWEMGAVDLLLDRVVKMRTDRGWSFYASMNFFGSCLFQTIALLCFAQGSPLGAVLATTWIGGSVLNILVYFNGNRWLLWSTLAPIAATAVVGPWLAFGFTWPSVVIPLLIGVSSLAARRFSLDHGALLRQLADRQTAVIDLERKLTVAIEASGDGYFENDLVAGSVFVSPNWVAMLGYAPDELPNPIPDWSEFVHPDDVPWLIDRLTAHFAGDISFIAAELRMRCKDGSYKWVFSRSRLVTRTPDGQPWQVVGTTIDISDRKALEHQLEAARDLAESANTAKGVFVANMSHEIRTPLNGVIGIAGALARTDLSADQREMVSLVQSSGLMLDRMLSDILDQAKIEAGNFQLQTAPFDLHDEIEAAAALMRARADEKGLGFRIVYGEGAEGVFDGDSVRIRQIVSNLTSNAIKFTAAGEVSVRVEVIESPGGDSSLVRIEIADTGVGFNAEAAAQLFNRFVQADGSISRQFGGTGLGLAICKSLADLMGGHISARSEPGVGSVFSVELPLPRVLSLADYRQRRAAGPIAGPEAVAGPQLDQIRVLLAEDHPTNQRVVQLILEPTGIALTVVGNGQEAVDIFQPGRFDLILMDMQMPVMDGLVATRAIRALEAEAACRPIPIAMFTANAMDEHLVLAAQAGANHHISKPITPARLLQGIELALSQDPDAAAPLRHVGL